MRTKASPVATPTDFTRVAVINLNPTLQSTSSINSKYVKPRPTIPPSGLKPIMYGNPSNSDTCNIAGIRFDKTSPAKISEVVVGVNAILLSKSSCLSSVKT